MSSRDWNFDSCHLFVAEYIVYDSLRSKRLFYYNDSFKFKVYLRFIKMVLSNLIAARERNRHLHDTF